MAFNVPTYEVARISFGPGVIYLGAAGATPTEEVGAVRGDMALIINRTGLQVHQGSPQTLITEYVQREEVRVRFTGIEWRVRNLEFLLGAGETSESGADEIFEFGGDQARATYAMRLVHKDAGGSTIDVHLFKVQGVEQLEIALRETDLHEFPAEFVALEGTTDFEGAALADKKKLVKITRTKA